MTINDNQVTQHKGAESTCVRSKSRLSLFIVTGSTLLFVSDCFDVKYLLSIFTESTRSDDSGVQGVRE